MMILVMTATTPALAQGGFPDGNGGNTDPGTQEGYDVEDYINQEQGGGSEVDFWATDDDVNDSGSSGLGDVVGNLGVQANIGELMNHPVVRQLTAIVGKLVTGMAIITVIWMVVGSGLDIIYIMVEPSRRFLNKEEAMGGNRGGMGMGGMGMGAQGSTGKTYHQLISAEARRIVAAAEGSAIGGNRGGMGGGMGMGGMGMSSMGGMNPQQAQTQAGAVSHPIKTYIKLRIKGYVWAVIAIVVLLFNFGFSISIGEKLADIIILVIVTIFKLITSMFGM